MLRLARSTPPDPGGPKRKLRTLLTTFVSSSEAGSEERYLRIDSVPLVVSREGLKKAWLRGISSATGRPLLSRNSTSSPSRLWPKRKAAVENSLAMPGFTVGLYPLYAGRRVPSSAGRNWLYVMD